MPVPVELALFGLVVGLTALLGLAFAKFGAPFLIGPLLIAAAIGIVAKPHEFSIILLAAAVTLEPGAIDFSRELSPVLYELPKGTPIPFSTTPLELCVFLALVSILVRGDWRRRRAHPPHLVFALLGAIALGFAYGALQGGAGNAAWNEGRGVVFCVFAFIITITAPPGLGRLLSRSLFVACGIAAAITLSRYWFHIHSGELTVAIEFAFAHEVSIILGVGFVLGLTSLVSSEGNPWRRFLLILYCTLIAVALFATGRRAATLVLIVGTLAVGGFMFPRRPMLIILLGIPSLLVVAAYLGAYWNQQVGVEAQPARAIRSQIDPNQRDESSDLYREIERGTALTAIIGNRIMGVGFGNPFASYLWPDLQSYWPLQRYTPHQSILWLWLKIGFMGLAAFLGVVGIAISRCMRFARTDGPLAEASIIVSATLLMYLSFATVDIAFVGARGTLLLGVALGIAFCLPTGPGQRDVSARAEEPSVPGPPTLTG